MLALYVPIGIPLNSYRGEWDSKQPALIVAWNDRPWTLTVHWDPQWVPQNHYVDITSVPDWSDGTLRLVDLDLDLVYRSGDKSPLLDDADEFEEHRVKFGYPDDLMSECLRTVLSVGAMMSRSDPPFDGSLYDWRPGRRLPPLQ